MIKFNEKYKREIFISFLRGFLPEDFSEKEKDFLIGEKRCKKIIKAQELGYCEELDLYILEMEHDSENDPRVSITTDAFKILADNWIHNALVIFKNKDSNNYRLSYLTISLDINDKNKAVKKYSNPKRKSFFLGLDSKTNTPDQYLKNKGRVKDIEDLESRFDVEVVTKEFFDNYKKLFVKLSNHLKEDEHFHIFADKNLIKIDDFAKKLLGQIVFIYFLQKKGWLGAKKENHIYEGDPVFLRSLYKKSELENENFFNDTLEYLFYDAFNKESERAGNFYREHFDCQIPFLNGGLFEPLNKYDWEKDFLHIPNELFSNNEKTGILDVFDLYNFTIDENSLIDQEVSVDPEMLGKVFEKLLDTNKETGSFYTPREIVSYMVKRSLIEYLKTKTSISETKILFLINDHILDEGLSKIDLNDIENALKEIKIIDPAVGSGAFPVGILQEMTEIRLLYQNQISTKPKTSYFIKKEILENNIYGVDIDHGAIDIARLRFWLSLVVDADLNDVEPLPNLDFKLTTANTLLKLDNQQGLEDNTKLLEEMKELRKKYFRARTKNGKDKIQESFKKLLKNSFTLFASERQRQILTYDPFSQSTITQFFDPEFMFGVRKFDLVIGNPPYVRQEKFKFYKKELKKIFGDFYNGRSDLYTYFIKLTSTLLINNGVFCYVTSNKFLVRGYGKSTREFLSEKMTLLQIINFGELPVFKASVDSSIILVSNRIPRQDEVFIFAQAKKKEDIENLEKLFLSKSEEIKISTLDENIWALGSSESLSILGKIKDHRETLDSYYKGKIFAGIKSGLDSAFVISEKTKDLILKKDPRSEELIKPWLRGRDIKKWKIDYKNLYIIYIPQNKIDIENYIGIKDHLFLFKSKLEKRATKQKWYEMQQPQERFTKLFESKKIIYAEIAKEMRACVDNSDSYGTMKMFFVPYDPVILGILNSSLFDWYSRMTFATLGDPWNGGRISFNTMYMSKTPIPSFDEGHAKKIKEIVEHILDLKNKDPKAETKMLERDLDDIIMDLYEINENEKSIITNSLK